MKTCAYRISIDSLVVRDVKFTWLYSTTVLLDGSAQQSTVFRRAPQPCGTLVVDLALVGARLSTIGNVWRSSALAGGASAAEH